MALLTINYGFTDTSQSVYETIENVKKRDEGQQGNKNVLPSHLLIVQKVVYPLPSKVMANVRPEEVVNGEEGQAEDVAVGWTWTSDGREEEDLEQGDYGAEEIEVEDGKGL